MSEKILIVEDDQTLQETLTYNLGKEGYKVFSVYEGNAALELAQSENIDLILLDVMLPNLDGLSICRILRRETDVPILLLTARTGEMDKIIGLDSGADDYITKPFSLGELFARIRVALRRRSRTHLATNFLSMADINIDLIGRKAEKSGQAINLSHKEFDLLVELIRNAGVVLSRDLLLTKVWGYDYAGGTRTVDVHVRWLREKIEQDPSSPKHILTIRGIGYRFEK